MKKRKWVNRKKSLYMHPQTGEIREWREIDGVLALVKADPDGPNMRGLLDHIAKNGIPVECLAH